MRGSPQHRWRDLVVRMGVYVSGMAVVYSFLGVLAGLTGQVFGTLTNSSHWYIAIGIVMTFSALVMLDVIPFDPLTWMENIKRRWRKDAPAHSHVVHKEITLLGAFTLGATSGFIAAPCTTPILTAILAYIAQTQSVGWGLSLMFFFALGLGTILIIIALFAGAIQFLPRSGGWMKKIKILSGLIILAFGQYLIYRAGVIGGQP